MANAKKDENGVSTIIGVSATDGLTPTLIYADPTTHALYVTNPGSGTPGVASLNGLTGAVILAEGENITLTPAGNTITIASTSVSDVAYGPSWNGVTTISPSKNAVYDVIESIVIGTGFVKTDQVDQASAQHVINASPYFDAGIAIGPDVTPNGVPSLAGGFITESGGFTADIISNSTGAMAFGVATSSTATTQVLANGAGAFALGYAEDGEIRSAATGALAGGYSTQGSIFAAGAGAISWGRATGISSQIGANGNGSFVMGTATNSSSGNAFMYAQGPASFAQGVVNNSTSSNGQTNSQGNASVVFGYNDGGTLTSSGTASFVVGRVGVNGSIVGQGNGSFTAATAIGGGSSTASVTNNSGGDTSVLFGEAITSNGNASLNNSGGFGYGLVNSANFNISNGSFGGGRVVGGNGFTVQLNATGNSSFAWGRVSGAYRDGTLSSSSSNGAFVSGYAESGLIESTANGSMVSGYALGTTNFSASLRSAADGGFAHGFASGQNANSDINASGRGSIAMGYAIDGEILSQNFGSFASGYTNFGSIRAENVGSFAGGGAIGSSGTIAVIRATQNGGFAWGSSDNQSANAGSISSTGSGAFAVGYANGGTLVSSANGSFVGGFAGGGAGGDISATATGSFAWGSAQSDDNSASISATGAGSFVVAFSQNGEVLASGAGATAFGWAQGNSTYQSQIIASTTGAFARGASFSGNSHLGQIISGGQGATASGSVNSAVIQASSQGSFANGYATSQDATETALIVAEESGAFAQGHAYASNSGVTAVLRASGVGSMAVGIAEDGLTQATGRASFALGENTQATADNAYTFGSEVTNSVADQAVFGWNGNTGLRISEDGIMDDIGTTVQLDCSTAGTWLTPNTQRWVFGGDWKTSFQDEGSVGEETSVWSFGTYARAEGCGQRIALLDEIDTMSPVENFSVGRDATGVNAVTFRTVTDGYNFDKQISIQSTITNVVGSTSGSADFTMPFQGDSLKKVMIYCSALLGTASYTFPTPFAHTPFVLGPLAGIATAVSTTAITVTGTTSGGFLTVEGF